MELKFKIKPCIIGLGYVGLPLALRISKYFSDTIGYDPNKKRINDLRKNVDKNNDIEKKYFYQSKKNILFTFKKENIKDCNFYIITVPTPVNKKKIPDLTHLKNACKLVAKYIKINDVVVIESTVYPGTTEEICSKVIEKNSKILCSNIHLKNKNTFHISFSPERINPGDKKRKIENIKKIISSSSKYGLDKTKYLYEKIIKAGIHVAESIKVAESAKIIENVQRDLNIALINEFSLICHKLNVNTGNVLKAASTKWNFLNFKPGLVGGHCIGIDPYYLAYKAKLLGHSPKLILAGRYINEFMATNILRKIKFLAHKKKINLKNSKILIVGATFKPDCSDYRNSKVIELSKKLCLLANKIEIYDPLISNSKFKKIGLKKINSPKKKYYDMIILAVAHKKIIKEFKKPKIYLKNENKNLIFDLNFNLKNQSYDYQF